MPGDNERFGATAGTDKTVTIAFTEKGKTVTTIVTGITVNFFVGNGLSATTAYEINTPAQLACLARLINVGATPYANNDTYYKLTADIDLSDYGAGFNGGKNSHH